MLEVNDYNIVLHEGHVVSSVAEIMNGALSTLFLRLGDVKQHEKNT